MSALQDLRARCEEIDDGLTRNSGIDARPARGLRRAPSRRCPKREDGSIVQRDLPLAVRRREQKLQHLGRAVDGRFRQEGRDGAAQCVFEDRRTSTGAVKANSSFFFQTGCWEDWSRYGVHGVKINDSQFTLGCAANQAPNTSPVDAPAMSVFQGQLYDVFESSQTLSW